MGCFCMPKGYRKYNGTQKVEIIKQIHRENLSFKGASREYGISDRHSGTGSAFIGRKEKKHF